MIEFNAGGTPGNIFATMVVTFATAGPVTVVFPAFGPPSDAHAWVYTDIDDTLLNGVSTIFREDTLLRSNESSFNLSHTCFVPAQETTTTTTTTPVGTTTTSGGTTTTISGGVTTTTTIAGRVTTTSASTGGAGGGSTTTIHSGLPVTVPRAQPPSLHWLPSLSGC